MDPVSQGTVGAAFAQSTANKNNFINLPINNICPPIDFDLATFILSKLDVESFKHEFISKLDNVNLFMLAKQKIFPSNKIWITSMLFDDYEISMNLQTADTLFQLFNYNLMTVIGEYQ